MNLLKSGEKIDDFLIFLVAFLFCKNFVRLNRFGSQAFGPHFSALTGNGSVTDKVTTPPTKKAVVLKIQDFSEHLEVFPRVCRKHFQLTTGRIFNKNLPSKIGAEFTLA